MQRTTRFRIRETPLPVATFYLSFHAAQNRFSTVLPVADFPGLGGGGGVMSRADIIAPAFFPSHSGTHASFARSRAARVESAAHRETRPRARF